MNTPTELFKWYVLDEITGRWRRTSYLMTRAEAAERFPGADPDLQTREVRMLPGGLSEMHVAPKSSSD